MASITTETFFADGTRRLVNQYRRDIEKWVIT
jgi:hypothetical protein